MEKMGLIKNSERMGKYELKQGYASYKTIVDYFIGDLVLCNNIVNIDESVYDNMEYETENEEDYPEIYQYFLCNLNQWEIEQAKKAGLILSYSDMLECDVLCVNHCGTSWDYVLTDVKLFDNYEDLQKYEEE